MGVVTTNDPAAIRRLLLAALEHDPLVNTICSSVERGLQEPDARGWAAHPEGSPLVLAARSTVHTPVVLTEGWRDLPALVEALTEVDPPVSSLMGPLPLMEAVAPLMPWPVTERVGERLFRLDELVPPTGVTGTARRADDADRDVVADWYAAFHLEAHRRLPPGFDARAAVEQRLRSVHAWLWCDEAGAPVSMAWAQPTVAGVARVGPVYTPERARGHGYGSAATAAATRDILDRPAVACLFTDLSNPTSNKIYQALGYRAVGDSCELRFD